MISSIYNKIYPYIPSFNKTNVKSAVIGAIGGIASYWLTKSLPLAILGAGATLFGCVKWIKGLAHSAVALRKPEGVSASITNRGNSCFCSSVLWSFFSNEPCVTELPKAIIRRISSDNLFSTPMQNLPMTDDQTQPIFEIAEVLKKRESFTKSDFDKLRGVLQTLEQVGFPTGCNEREMKELLTLLELYQLVDEFQNTSSMSGNRVNAMRKMAARVNNTFKDTGTQMGDAEELFRALADLIFSKSSYERTLFRYSPEVKAHNPEPNWGDFSLPLEKGKSLSVMFKNHLGESQFSSPPPFLALTLIRSFLNRDSFDPIIPDLEFKLPKTYLVEGADANYELVGISRRRQDSAHYDAYWKREDQWYYGNELLTDEPVYPVEASTIQKHASNGYLFFYRLKS